MTPPDHQGVVMDTHIYQVFSNNSEQVAMSQSQHIQAACAQISALKEYKLCVVVGEWAPATSITDCALSLNGRGVGARYDGSFSGSHQVGSCTGMSGAVSGFSSDYKSFLRQYWEAIGIALEAHRLDLISYIYKLSNDASLLAYAMDSVLDTNFSLSYRDEVLRFLLPLFPPLKAQATYINAVTCLLVTLGDPSLAIPLLTSLVQTENLLAYQLAFDLVEGGAQDFLEAIRLELPEGDSVRKLCSFRSIANAN